MFFERKVTVQQMIATLEDIDRIHLQMTVDINSVERKVKVLEETTATLTARVDQLAAKVEQQAEQLEQAVKELKK